jgi:hypothetical protein
MRPLRPKRFSLVFLCNTHAIVRKFRANENRVLSNCANSIIGNELWKVHREAQDAARDTRARAEEMFCRLIDHPFRYARPTLLFCFFTTKAILLTQIERLAQSVQN